tara:strand:- start:526 stop:639 length:114 start_codon:yes stop_codon:yes gene_type:complete
MCGFAEYINKNSDQINQLIIKKIMQLQEHRGHNNYDL